MLGFIKKLFIRLFSACKVESFGESLPYRPYKMCVSINCVDNQ